MTPDSLIESLGGTSQVAAALALGAPVVSNWRARGKIPAEFWTEIVALATERGVIGITSEALATMHARRAVDEDAEARP